MSAYSATLSDEVMSAARRSFERYDHDNSGTIQVEVYLLHECQRWIARKHLHQEFLQDICRALTEARRDASEAQVRIVCILTLLLVPGRVAKRGLVLLTTCIVQDVQCLE